MGAAMLLPLAISALGSVVSSVFAPPAPKQTIIEPGAVSPALSQSAANQIAATTAQKGQEFGQSMLDGILANARKQGLSADDTSSIQKEFSSWLNTRAGQESTVMNTLAQQAQDQANYTNTINQQNFQTQLAAANAANPQGSGILGAIVPGLINGALGGLTGGMGGGAPVVDNNSYMLPPGPTNSMVYGSPTPPSSTPPSFLTDYYTGG